MTVTLAVCVYNRVAWSVRDVVGDKCSARSRITCSCELTNRASLREVAVRRA